MTYEPYRIIGADRPSRWLVTCDHAANTVPPFVNNGELGLAKGDMERHIAYDVGAAGVTTALAEALNAPAILSNFSRLVIDPNRGEDDPTLLMKLYDGTALAELAARRDDTVILSIHSFTRQLQGRDPRPWHIGVLYAADDRLAKPLIARLDREHDLCVGENQPYGGHLPGDAIARHAIAHQRLNVLVEIRNDLIENDQHQEEWARRLAPMLEEALASTGQ